MTARPPADAGFTLVEALVSLFVVSLLSLGCLAVVSQSVISQKRVAAAQADLRAVQNARALLSADLAQLVNRSVRGLDGSRAPIFEGGGDPALAFVRAGGDPEPGKPLATTLVYVQYVFENGALVRKTSPYLDPNAEGELSERVIFPKAERAKFQFFDGSEWRDDWVGEAASAGWPRAVALIATVPRYGEVRLEMTTGRSL